MTAAIDRYAPVLASPTCIEDFDTAIGAVVRDQLGGSITGAQATTLEAEVRHQREEWIMRRGG